MINLPINNRTGVTSFSAAIFHTPSKKKYYENFLLVTKKVLMKTVAYKEPANSDLSILRVHPIFLQVNALVYVDIDLGIH